MTAVKRILTINSPEYAERSRCDDLAERIEDAARQLGVVGWACHGLQGTIGGGEHLDGFDEMLGRISGELEAIANEVRR